MSDLTPPFHEGYSVWFMVEQESHNMLQAQIDRLAGEYGGDQFMAHGTVIGLGEKKKTEFQDLAEKTQQLLEGVKKFEVEVIGLGARNMYFQSLFLMSVPSAPLIVMNQQARKLFDHESDPPYMPHMSLMYGNFDWATKQQAARSIDFAFPMRIQVHSIALVDVQGNPPDWKVITEYPLQ